MNFKSRTVLVILILLIVAGGLLWYLRPQSKNPDPTPNTPETKTFRGVHQAWFEGFDIITYEFKYPNDKFEVISNDPTNRLVFKNKVTGATEEILITYEGGRGFSPADYFEEVLKKSCLDCQMVPNKVNIGESSSVLTVSNSTNEWIMFVPQNTPWLYVAKLSKPTVEAGKIIESFHIVESKTGQPSSQFGVYFSNNKIPNETCREGEMVGRIIPQTPAIARAAIEELLKGPAVYEKEQGYGTSIPAGSKLNSIKIENGVAYVDFNQVTQSGGGSCSMAARHNQITKTLLQFPTIKSVVISIEGQTEDIFQP